MNVLGRGLRRQAAPAGEAVLGTLHPNCGEYQKEDFPTAVAGKTWIPQQFGNPQEPETPAVGESGERTFLPLM